MFGFQMLRPYRSAFELTEVIRGHMGYVLLMFWGLTLYYTPVSPSANRNVSSHSAVYTTLALFNNFAEEHLTHTFCTRAEISLSDH